MENKETVVAVTEPKKGKMVDCIICGGSHLKGESKFLKDLDAYGGLSHHGISKAP